MTTRYFSTFTGVGGLDWGLEEVGAKCVGFSEIKKTSEKIYKSHYPLHVNFGDITQINPHSLPDFDVLIGGFPCQSFSLAGLRKGLEDGKGKKGAMVLYLHRILQVKQPMYFVFENVKGILNHDGGKTFQKVFRVFENAGYYVRVIMLNALYYGSAQNRERVIFLGSKESFDAVRPGIVDDTKRFRDVFDFNEASYRVIKDTERNRAKIEQLLQFSFELVGKWDRVGTLTTQMGCGEKAVPYGDWFRMLTVLECERLQGFPDGWTEGVSDSARYFAMGNAVNCGMSRYLFTDYLPRLWKTGWQALALKNMI
jgi:DNA-cytosine methyltransferase